MNRTKVRPYRPIRTGDLVAQHGREPACYWPAYMHDGRHFKGANFQEQRWVVVGVVRSIQHYRTGQISRVYLHIDKTVGPWSKLDIEYGPITHAGSADRRRWERAMRDVT